MQDQTNTIDWNSIFEYRDGSLYWLITCGSNVKNGDIAGTVNGNGRCQIMYRRKAYYTHRIIYEIHYGEIPSKMQIDHIDGNKTNNLIENLRLATNQENGRNRGAQQNNSLGIKGVCRSENRKKFIARIKENGKIRHLGVFLTADLASAAYKQAAKNLHGIFYRN